MVVQWTARRAAVLEDEEIDVLCVAIAEHEDGGGRCLMFQAGLTELPDGDDLDEVYSLVTETEDCVGGGVRQLHLAGKTLSVVLSRKAATALDLPSRRLKVSLEVGPDSIEELRDGLARIFDTTMVSSRPWRLSLPGTTVPVQARPWWRWPPWGHGPRGRRVTFRVVAIRGQLVDTVAETGPSAGEPGVGDLVVNLTNQFGLAPDQLVGQRISYLLIPDRFGISYASPRLEKPR